MHAMSHKDVPRPISRFILCALMLTGVALVAAPAQAAEIIPSLGMTRSPENSDQTNISYGLAIRSSLAPMVAAEVGMSYRKEELFGGIVESTQWPITGSLWLKPVSMFYVGGGVGWYNTTLSYPNLPILASTTSQDFGIHLGGGLSLPLVPGVASLDLNGRYVYLGNQASELPPNEFNADHWTTTLGLAIGF